MAWQTPFLSVLIGTDKDALQRIFTSLQQELERLDSKIQSLEAQKADKQKAR